MLLLTIVQTTEKLARAYLSPKFKKGFSCLGVNNVSAIYGFFFLPQIQVIADDTAILAVHQKATEAANLLENNMNKIEKQTKKWRIRMNESK